jgi:LmbE family N-acetylglucosaminyl deacetylase
VVSFDAHAGGTPSILWETDYRFTLAAEADLDEIRELVVIAAHPDDETLGAGGLIALAADRNVPITVIVVTDGSASHPSSMSVTTQRLRALRAEEVRTAVARLAPDARIAWLGYPDGRTDDFAPQIEQRLIEELARVDPHAHIVVVWTGDGHSDHEAVGRIVNRVAAPEATIWSYPIWLWHWGHPDAESLPWDRVLAVPLTDRILDRKEYAISAYVSQIEPLSDAVGDERMLEPEVLEHFRRDRELFLLARAGTA